MRFLFLGGKIMKKMVYQNVKGTQGFLPEDEAIRSKV